MGDVASVVVVMAYDGGQLSKNRLFLGGNRRTMNPVAKAWKAILADSIRYALLAEGIAKAALPLTIEVRAFYTSRGKASDPQNLIELISDAAQEATGLDDLDYQITTYPPVFRVTPPRIEITVRAANARLPDTAATVSGSRARGKDGNGKGSRSARAVDTPPTRGSIRDGTEKRTTTALRGRG